MTMTSKKAFQNALRALMVAGSLSGFLVGWSFFAHSGKPASGISLPEMSTTPPATTSESAPPSRNVPLLAPSANGSTTFQALPSLPSAPTFMPRLRTRGS